MTISTPIIVWMSYQALVIMTALITAATRKSPIHWAGLAAAIGLGTWTTTLLMSSFTASFLFVEIIVWGAGFAVGALEVATHPPTGPNERPDGWRFALAVSGRLAIALGVWLSL